MLLAEWSHLATQQQAAVLLAECSQAAVHSRVWSVRAPQLQQDGPQVMSRVGCDTLNGYVAGGKLPCMQGGSIGRKETHATGHLAQDIVEI